MTKRKNKHRRQDENAKLPRDLTELPREQWAGIVEAGRLQLSVPSSKLDDLTTAALDGLQRIWVSRDYLVQQHAEEGAIRLSVTARRGGLGWDQLQKIKRDCGHGDRWAVEIFPADSCVVNVANMRHLWIPDEPLPIGWR